MSNSDDLKLSSRWLEAHCDRSASLTTLPNNLIVADIMDDGDYRLILIDLKTDHNQFQAHLKTYKSTLLVSDQLLTEIPCGLITFYPHKSDRTLPIVGVGCGSDLLLYKNNKAFYKFSIPPLTPSSEEIEIWTKLHKTQDNIEILIDELKTLPFNSLTGRSQELINLPLNEQKEFIKQFEDKELIKKNIITCMTVIYKTSREKYSAGCPIIATESGNIFILDPQNFSILHQASVSHTKVTPSIIKATGLYDVDYRILIGCRENQICLLKKGWLEGEVFVHLCNDIVDMVNVPGDGFTIVATTNKLLHCFTKRGLKLWTNVMTDPITCMCLINLKHLSTYLVAIGLRNGLIHLYHGRHSVDLIVAPDTPSAIIFGQLGQEEHVLIIITLGGTMNFKILKRTADFNLSNKDKLKGPTLQNTSLPLPKRSKLFLEHSQRERQNAKEMHQNFQQDLVKLKLITARALTQNLTNQIHAGNEEEQIKLSAQVLGLGPKFSIILTLENISIDKAIYNFLIVFHAKPSIYAISTYIFTIPLIPPGLSYKIETKVEEKIQQEQQFNLMETEQNIKVFLLRKNVKQPLLAATIRMPNTESFINL